MSDLENPGGGDVLTRLVTLLRDAPGICWYVDVFPRLQEGHPRALADGRGTPRDVAAELLTEAARRGPSAAAAAAAAYRELGELPALRLVADAETVATATIEWQREVDRLLGQAERRAALLDDEGVLCEGGVTWVKRVRDLRDLVGSEHSHHPASQRALIGHFLTVMDEGLIRQKGHLKGRLEQASSELERSRHTLEDEAVRHAETQIEGARQEIDGDNLLIALRKLAVLEALVRGRAPRIDDGGGRRLPLPLRRNPLGGGNFHFGELISTVRRGPHEFVGRTLEAYLPDHAAEEAAQPNGFLQRHATRRAPEWGSYFAALREWLGLSESRSSKRVRRLQRLDLPNLEPKGAYLAGRWTFLATEPWDGAPFYEDSEGRSRILAVVRLAVADEDRNRPQIVLKHAGQALRELLGAMPAAQLEDERRFRDDGLLLVLLPGEILSSRRYEQFRREVPLEKAANWAGRIAYLDDLDLLRLVPVRSDERFRALLEAALPRFPDALSQTYQHSDAVRSRMFFGRRDELARLWNGTTVVFSGRKMGKSSLLHRLRCQCGPDTDQRAVLVGCSAVARGRSWIILNEIEREFARLAHREALEGAGSADAIGPGPFDADPVEAMRAAKERFRSTLDRVMHLLEARGVRRLFLLLDEADSFVRAEMEETSGGRDPRSAVSWFLRDLQTSTYPGRLRFVFAGYDQIGRVFRDPGLGHSAFGNWGEQPLRLGPLDEGAARDLIVQPLTALGMTVNDDLAERILDYTSGHASLIQAFCRKLAERVRETRSAWPLEDAAVSFEDVQGVADDQRGAGDQNYRQLLEQTLGLNLDIGRAYPLKLLFLALVSPTGLGSGRVLGTDPFRLEDALEQARPPEGAPMGELSPTLVLDSLDLLAQLGLLEDVSDSQNRAYSFKARHYVNVLRSKNGFRDQLRQAMDDWVRSGRRTGQAEPRYVWTLPDSELSAMRQRTARAAVVVGLPGTGRGYLSKMLSSPHPGGDAPTRLVATEPGFRDLLAGRIASGGSGLTVVLDGGDAVPWEEVTDWLTRAEHSGVPLRWVGGPRLAWGIAGDLDVAIRIDGPYGLGPLTAAELEPWTARELGGEGPPSAASVPEPEREPLLQLTGGLLPVLEMFREWLLLSYGQLPDPLRLAHAEAYWHDLSDRPARAARAAERFARGLPGAMRTGLHHLFRETQEWGEGPFARADLPAISGHLDGLGDESGAQLLDAAGWLGLVSEAGLAGEVIIPQSSLVGLLVRQTGFAAP